MYQSGRAGDEAKKRKSPAKSGRVGITAVPFRSKMVYERIRSWTPGRSLPYKTF